LKRVMPSMSDYWVFGTKLPELLLTS